MFACFAFHQCNPSDTINIVYSCIFFSLKRLRLKMQRRCSRSSQFKGDARTRAVDFMNTTCAAHREFYRRSRNLRQRFRLGGISAFQSRNQRSWFSSAVRLLWLLRFLPLYLLHDTPESTESLFIGPPLCSWKSPRLALTVKTRWLTDLFNSC